MSDDLLVGTYRLRPVEAIQWVGTNRSAVSVFVINRGLLLRPQGEVLWLFHQWFALGPGAGRADPFPVRPGGWLVWDGVDISVLTDPQFVSRYEADQTGDTNE